MYRKGYAICVRNHIDFGFVKNSSRNPYLTVGEMSKGSTFVSTAYQKVIQSKIVNVKLNARNVKENIILSSMIQIIPQGLPKIHLGISKQIMAKQKEQLIYRSSQLPSPMVTNQQR